MRGACIYVYVDRYVDVRNVDLNNCPYFDESASEGPGTQRMSVKKEMK